MRGPIGAAGFSWPNGKVAARRVVGVASVQGAGLRTVTCSALVEKGRLLQPESRACYQRLLDQSWLDALPREPIYTFCDHVRQHWEGNAGLRNDHIMLNNELAPRLIDVGVDS
jgi:exonuclease III